MVGGTAIVVLLGRVSRSVLRRRRLRQHIAWIDSRIASARERGEEFASEEIARLAMDRMRLVSAATREVTASLKRGEPAWFADIQQIE